MKKRVLITDDSVVMRQFIRDVVEQHPELEVAGVAANGSIALQKLEQVSPDIVTLDIEMPVLDGISTLKELRKVHPKLPVIVFSTLTDRGAEKTMEALSAGASDYLRKPTDGNRGEVAEELARKVKALLGLDKELFSDAHPKPPRRKPSAAAVPPRILCVGVSTGGPKALSEFIPLLPADFPLPICIVQHMPPRFTAMLAERLDALSPLKVREARDGEVLRKGEVWIAPGDFHMVLEKEEKEVKLVLNQAPAENSCRPAVDPLFRSVAEIYGPAALGVILTGMGQDGLLGSRSLVEAGGVVLAQDEATSVVWGMPGFVAKDGLAQEILPLQEIAGAVTRRAAAFANVK